MSTETAATPTTWTQVARIVFPSAGEEDTLPLYVDFGRAAPIQTPDAPGAEAASSMWRWAVAPRSTAVT